MLTVVKWFCGMAIPTRRKRSRRSPFLERHRIRQAEPLEPRHLLTAPVAVNDEYTTQEDAPLFLVPAATGVLANDTDAERDPLKAVVVDRPRNGQLVLNDNGGFFYDAANDFFGVDTFTYRAEDAQPSNLATVTINVTPLYDAPRPVNYVYKFRPGQVIRVTPETGVLANDGDADGRD